MKMVKLTPKHKLTFGFILVILLAFLMSLNSCSSESGKKAQQKKTNTKFSAPNPGKDFRVKVLFKNSDTTYYQAPQINIRKLDTMYRVGDTVFADVGMYYVIVK